MEKKTLEFVGLVQLIRPMGGDFFGEGCYSEGGTCVACQNAKNRKI